MTTPPPTDTDDATNTCDHDAGGVRVLSEAVISECGQYRYILTRKWGEGRRLALFIMLNPSTADAEQDDPTIRRCIGFAKREACDGLQVVNLYALRSTDPKNLWTAEDPVGPDNDMWIAMALLQAQETDSPVIAAWGSNAKPHRVYKVKQIAGMHRAQAIGYTKDRGPRHPLYIKKDAPLLPLTPPATTHTPATTDTTEVGA